MMIINY